MHSTASVTPTLSVTLSSVTSITAKAKRPGEISGPALAVTVRVTNRGSERVPVDGVVVNLADQSGRPGLPLADAPARPFRGSVAAHTSADGTYVFTVPTDRRSPVTVTVTLTASKPVVLFRGNAT